jgi:methionyl-tRNA formyltransferase
MRTLFFGATDFGYKCCEFVIENSLTEITGIFTIPESFRISYSDSLVKNYTYRDFSEIGEKYNIPVTEVTQKMSFYTDEIKSFKADFILVAGWYYKIPAEIINSVSKGCAGFHSSLLPKYRGGAPLVWALINGETETGITFFYFDEGTDTGDIIAQKKILIAEDDNIKTLTDKTTAAAFEILREFIPMIANGTAPRIKQDHSQATYYPQRKPEDGLIDWSWEPQRIKNFIRAQTKPYPGAFTIINGKKVIIWDADIEKP